MTAYQVDRAAFAREGRAELTRIEGERAAEAILVRRVTQCVAEGLHAYDGHCDACGVSVK